LSVILFLKIKVFLGLLYGTSVDESPYPAFLSYIKYIALSITDNSKSENNTRLSVLRFDDAL